MKLRELLAKVPSISLANNHPALETEIKGLATNSHACQTGDLFLGMPGTRVDGGEFWESAIANGAVAALVSQQAAQKHQPKNECVIPVADMTQTCPEVATAFYDYPGQKMKMVGITGTNGKTTTTHLVEFLLNNAQLPTALFGTLYSRWPGFEETAAYTTPFPVELQKQLAQAVAAGSKYGVMEVSSHSLHQKRVWGCSFEMAVFTNLTQDHLDYHKDMDDYFEAKALLFSSDYLKGRAIVNADDPYGKKLIARMKPEQVWSYSTSNTSADFWASDLEYQPTGVKGILHTPQGEIPFSLPLVGQYNLSNMLAAVGTALHLGLDLAMVVAHLSEFPGVPGRMEKVQVSNEQDVSVIVDYAHTPDSLENLLKAARPFIPGRMICVFGCGGDRDRTKRPKMGKIAAELSDLAVVTSDNPRTEDPEKILQDVLEGISPEIKHLVIGDRSQAIRTAIMEAKPGDGVLIAGKGHEDYQILGTEKIHFDDREQARDALNDKYDLSQK
ncbi:UDP-N-acetylmuramoyl-L-alanyl-D-glutamate--2,6-diaminopimelate ligase [Okeania sp. SIO1F9]|uniref:UDP-N-acetylmuramoyl-L-alanyl-D-glutamate--2, 6-diaminopimelate ligase n=1 Tax=Okeania sp. SIO1F9 TaxID=2607813 RepID=UPI0014508F3E|nr:UDP-N-acetylmuramoyl-L-alanyl-D-glutamate--2,6-diaminopimelate ligase [Okeania sp. SIO1F9]NET74553.1 UDP-N-acetylmuramoyl-L-alanyl-D-glutamate--2,6-diaminopimelate ligase [Okeania sp. SIO1F9]